MQKLQKVGEYLLKLYKITCPFLGKRQKQSGSMKALFCVQSEVQLHKLTQSNFLSVTIEIVFYSHSVLIIN